MNKTSNMFDIKINNFSWEDLKQEIKKTIEVDKQNKYLLTVNVDHIVKIQKDLEFKDIYQKADYVTPDGVPIMWASKILKQPLQCKISGSDLLPNLLEFFEESEYKIFFLGAAEGVAKSAADEILKKHPKIKIVGTYSPSYGFENNQEENEYIISMLKEVKPDILFVGVGAPKQEKWIYKYKDEYNIPLSIGVGATFDFIAGNVKRAPLFMQKIGLEWFWRFMQEPKRLFKRYFIDDSKFIGILVSEIFK